MKGRTAYRKFMGECLKKAPASTGEGNRGQSKRREPARLSGLAHTARIFQKYRGRRREAGATNPSANVVPRRGTEVFRFLIFTVPERGHVKLDPCLADAPCRLPGPATSKCDRAMRPPLFDLRRPV